jgi:ribosomal protein S10
MIKYLYIKSSCNYTLQAYVFYLQKTFKLLNLNISVFSLPRVSKKITLLKSPHVFKKAKEQFELREYKAVIKIIDCDPQFLNKIKFVLFNRPKSIQLKIKS